MRKLFPSLLSLAIASGIMLNQSVMADESGSSVANTDLEVIVVSGNKVAKPLKDVVGSISVMTSTELDKQLVNDMNQLFRYDPSIKITGSQGSAQNFVVRGMGSDRVLMIKDGMRMNEGYGANGLNDVVGRGFIETETLKQVEVAKGAASSIYGSDALGGIVVFVTKDAEDYLQAGETFAGKVKAGYYDDGEQAQLAATFALKQESFQQVLHLSARRGEEQQNYQGSLEPFEIDSESLLYKARYDLASGDKLGVSVDIWRQDTQGDSADGLLAYFRNLAKYGYHIADESISSEKRSEALKFNYQSYNGVWYDVLEVNAYRNHTQQQDSEYGFLDINAPKFRVVEKRHMWKNGDYEQTTLGLLSHASKQLNAMHTLGFGVDVETTESLRNTHELRTVEGKAAPTKDELTAKFPKNDTLRAGAYINDEISLSEGKWLLTPGVRLDHYDMDPNGKLKVDGTPFKAINETHASLNFGARYAINPSLNAYFQYGQGFKVPAYDLAYIEHSMQPSSEYAYEVIPADDLAPETSDTYELGLRGYVGEVVVNAAVYYNRFDDFLDTELVKRDMVRDGEGNFSHIKETYRYQNIDSVTIKGIELGARYDLNANWHIQANASYQDGKDDATGEYLTTISPLSGNIGVSYEQDAISSELVLTLAKRMTKVNAGKEEIAGYGTLDWLASYAVNADLSVNLAVYNLFDKEYVDFNNVAGHDEGQDLSRLTEVGRNFALTLSYQF
ncbi:TonB-dependent hemoglobin/transferrin/lactoferrin family receptor [Pseudoalteromonas fenneropenaei]|uniref:TonB-dependent hemoglobin/transferrin/lactoferrin family receptor n=1 Tax=Pseudoalteromonas fenneropenaei TaxID=1737459 RepID=A0ABV7CJP2_9GAMM